MPDQLFRATVDANGKVKLEPGSGTFVADGTPVDPGTPVTPPVGANPANTQWLGTNLDAIKDYTTDLPFVNHFRHRRPWAVNGSYATPVARDADGNVIGLTTGQTATSYLFTAYRRPGIYQLKYAGTAPTLAGVSGLSGGSGTLTFTLPATGNVSLSVTKNDTKLLSLVHSTDDPAKEFNADFLKRLSKYGVVRFMDWQQTNVMRTNLAEDFVEHACSYATYQEGGPFLGSPVPVPVMIRLANEADVNPWFCIPANADDAYIDKFVGLVAKGLKSNLVAYFENSNEIWNGQFPQSAYMAKGSAVWQDRMYNHAKQTAKITDVAKAKMGVRGIGVLGGWCSNSYWSGEMKAYLVKNKLTVPDFVAVGAYFGNDPQLNDKSGPLTAAVIDATLPKLVAQFAAHQTAYGAGKVLAYEGGSHLIPGINTHKEAFMEATYASLLNQWKAATNGAVFCHFSAIAQGNDFGAWGEKDYFDAPETPRSKAIGKILGR